MAAHPTVAVAEAAQNLRQSPPQVQDATCEHRLAEQLGLLVAAAVGLLLVAAEDRLLQSFLVVVDSVAECVPLRKSTTTNVVGHAL